jgi:hypothetical protein
MTNLNSRMDCFIQGTFVYIPRAYIIQDNSNASRFTYSWTFWLQQNHGIDIKRFLVVTNVEISGFPCFSFGTL